VLRTILTNRVKNNMKKEFKLHDLFFVQTPRFILGQLYMNIRNELQ
jgi:hypothetical protein